MAGPSNRHYKCTYPHKVISGGKISLKGTCVSKKGRKVAVQGSGAYTLTSFTLTAEIATEFLGLDISGKASTDAHRIGDTCPQGCAQAVDGRLVHGDDGHSALHTEINGMAHGSTFCKTIK
jgi:hypothetical protein